MEHGQGKAHGRLRVRFREVDERDRDVISRTFWTGRWQLRHPIVQAAYR